MLVTDEKSFSLLRMATKKTTPFAWQQRKRQKTTAVKEKNIMTMTFDSKQMQAITTVAQIGGLLSLIGSSIILRAAIVGSLHSRERNCNQHFICERILGGMSLCDICMSLGFVLSRWMVLNDTTCRIQGFFVSSRQLSLLLCSLPLLMPNHLCNSR